MGAIGNDPRYTSSRHFAVAGCDLGWVCELLTAWRGGALGLPAFEFDGMRKGHSDWDWGEARGPVCGVNVTQVLRIGDTQEWAFLTNALSGATTDVSVFWAAEASDLVNELGCELPSLLGCPVVRRRG